jgi:hypothetical protein
MGRMLEKDALRMQAEEFTLLSRIRLKYLKRAIGNSQCGKRKAESSDSAPDLFLKMHDGLLGLLLEPPGIHENHAILHQSV